MIDINRNDKTASVNKYDFQGMPSPSKMGIKLIEKYQENYIREYLSDVPKNADIMEIGGGKGFFANACIKREWNYCTIEKSAIQTDKFLKRGIRAINASVPPLPTHDKMFDLVHADQVVEHLNNHDEAILFVQECWRVLKPNGLLSIVCPNIMSQKFYFYEVDYSHSYPTSKYRLEWLLKDYGFEISYAGFFLNWNNSKHLVVRATRPVLLLLFNFIRLPVVAFLLDFLGLGTLRKRVLKTCTDNVVIIGRKNPL
ncbi:MAG: methyltransferase domain-containing protein [Cyclobacteriaceae bacterium]